MGLFSLQWFKSQKQKELEELKIKEQKLRNKLLKKELHNNLPVEDRWCNNDSEELLIKELFPLKPYKNIKLVNDVLTITLTDGNVIVKPQATQEDFINVRKCSTEEEIFIITAGREVVEEKKKELKAYNKAVALKDGIDKLANLIDFEIKGSSVYLKEIDRSLPQLLVERFLEIIEEQKYYTGFGDLQKDLNENEEYNSLKRFFMWCCLNPRAEVADMLYDFLVKNSFNITKQGFFVALRNVVTISEGGESNELVHFISNSYNKIKAVWKKKPEAYTVGQDSDGTYSLYYNSFSKNWKSIGNLKDLYLDLPNMKENRFTDDWTKTFDIRIGRVVSMPKEECEWNLADCASAGLHFTADQINYVGCGDTSVLVLINPMKVVGIGGQKGRCYEYLPIMTVPREEATEILHDLDFDTLELDEQYAIDELAELEEKVKEGFAVEAKKHQFNIPQINNVQINKIVKSLTEMKKEIEGRVKKI